MPLDHQFIFPVTHSCFCNSAELLLRIRADDPEARCCLGNKFGASPSDGPALLATARALGLSVVGVRWNACTPTVPALDSLELTGSDLSSDQFEAGRERSRQCKHSRAGHEWCCQWGSAVA